MRKRRGISILVPLTALLLTAPAASASSEIGWDCTANDTEVGWTVLAASSSNLPMADFVPPEGPKVITGWRVKVGAGLGPLPQRLEVFEIKNEEHEFEKIGESATETLVEGINSFATRISADEGDSVGLYGPAGTLICREAGAVSRLFEGSVASGEIKPFTTLVGEDRMPLEVGTPLVVTVEDDRDGDGYGDETQDRCPTSATTQGECSKLRVGVVRVRLRPVVIVVKLRPTSRARIKVSGQVQLRSRDTDEDATAARLTSGPPQTAGPGDAATAKLWLPARVRRSLHELDPQQVLKATLTIRATDSSKRVTRRKLTVKLKGRANG